ncbi:MAG: sigma-54 dependent transcriptional regulator [Candidatus Marinimicrobia bacterium]|nr:sigma-54 dependent transcriptional regulator [Candidatus Neomarinimicrobiota bacterium]MCF7850030.1 sigma-54 dependent transcriptional regulator [Candidatus Neomarinimicrobiota bacterium]
MEDYKILIVDDEEGIRKGLKKVLTSEGYDVDTAQDGKEALQMFNDASYELIFSDIMMPSMTGLDLTTEIRKKSEDTYIVLFTGYSSIETAVEAIKTGADEYLVKPVSNEELLKIAKKIHNVYKIRLNNKALRQAISGSESTVIIGNSSGIRKVKSDIEQVSQSDIAVLITGKTGTGKELVARSIHEKGKRKDHPFVAINCAAIPHDLLESELFGHERGAFSGANARKYGLFEVANKGTILLDEIGEMDERLQAKLLRTLESGQFRRVGGHKELESDFRVLTSTNRDLKSMVGSGSFREDLFYRLSPFIIDVPPLSKRKSDIPKLVEYVCTKKGLEGVRYDSESEFIQRLMNYSWPGNVRELQNALERVLLLSGGKDLKIEKLPPEILQVSENIDNSYQGESDILPLEEIEREHILKAYHELGGNKSQVARVLGISLRTLYNRLEKYDI